MARTYKEATTVLKKDLATSSKLFQNMDILMSTESVTSTHDLNVMTHLYNTFESQESLGVALETYGSLLSSVLMNKLPPTIHLIVIREVGDENWELSKLLETFEREL